MANTSTLEVSFINKSLAMRPTVGGVVGQWEYHPVCNFVSLTGKNYDAFATRNAVTNQRKHRFKWDDMLRIIIETNGTHQNDIDFDINQVTNQAGWTANAAGVNQCIADINGWIAQCNTAAAGAPAGATETTQLAVLAELTKAFDFELKCVRDTATGIIYIMRIQKDESTGAITIDYLDATGAVVVPPTPANLVVCDASAALGLLLAELQLKADLTETQPVSLASAVRTYTTLIATGAGSIPAGAIVGSAFNQGGVAGTFNGTAIAPGETIPVPLGHQGDTYGAIAYDGTGTSLLIQFTS